MFVLKAIRWVVIQALKTLYSSKKNKALNDVLWFWNEMLLWYYLHVMNYSDFKITMISSSHAICVITL